MKVPGGSGKRSLPMVCPFAIGKAFGLAAATRDSRSPDVANESGLPRDVVAPRDRKVVRRT
jgi:hypothetical protein